MGITIQRSFTSDGKLTVLYIYQIFQSIFFFIYLYLCNCIIKYLVVGYILYRLKELIQTEKSRLFDTYSYVS
jgi:hypothetical protein